MAFQVVDVPCALLSVYRMCEAGHDVVFSKAKGDYILFGGDTAKCIPMRKSGGTYELDVWLKPANPEATSDFGRQGNDR